MPKSILSTCLALALTLAAGCGEAGGPVPPEKADDQALFEVGELCRYYEMGRKGPAKNLAELGTARGMAANGYELVRTGKVIVRYGASLLELKEEIGDATSDEVLAFMPSVPESGGKVMTTDRRVKVMTAEEFKAAKLAGTSSSQAAPEPKK